MTSWINLNVNHDHKTKTFSWETEKNTLLSGSVENTLHFFTGNSSCVYNGCAKCVKSDQKWNICNMFHWRNLFLPGSAQRIARNHDRNCLFWARVETTSGGGLNVLKINKLKMATESRQATGRLETNLFPDNSSGPLSVFSPDQTGCRSAQRIGKRASAFRETRSKQCRFNLFREKHVTVWTSLLITCLVEV